MAAVIIKQEDLKRLGKEVLNDVIDFFSCEYILSEFEDMKKEKEKFYYYLLLNHISTLCRRHKITKEKEIELLKRFGNFHPLKLNDENNEEIKDLKEGSMKDDGVDAKSHSGY